MPSFPAAILTSTKMSPVVTAAPVADGGDDEQAQEQQLQQQIHKNAPRTTPVPTQARLRTMTSHDEIDHNLTRPGSVRINVKGAFIVDQDAPTPAGAGPNGRTSGRVSPTHHETSDIRLPNHTAVVSHIAVDV